jgi:ribonuclease BN (tRNA processing enzyme)
VELFVTPSTFPGGQGQALAGFVIDGCIALDAGAIGLCGTAHDQARIRHIVLSHAHIDHIATLPVLLDNVYMLRPTAPTVYGLPHTIRALQNDLFNNRLMPDLAMLMRLDPPFLTLQTIEPGHAFHIDGYSLMPLEVAHPIPTVCYLVTAPDGCQIAYVTDTNSWKVLEQVVSQANNLKAVFLEASFPNSMANLAHVTGHLTSSQFVEAARGVLHGIPTYAIHIKPRYYQEVVAEIRSANLPNVQITESGQTYSFPPANSSGEALSKHRPSPNLS